MRIWPVLIDSQPEYLRGQGTRASLLLAPLGILATIGHLRTCLEPSTRRAVTILPPAAADAGLERALGAAWPGATVVTTRDAFADTLGGFEPSDALFVVDPRRLAAGPREMSRLVQHYAAEPRIAHHLVAFERAHAGTKEGVAFDSRGQVRGVHRFYDEATWPFIAGTAATLLPVASGILSDGSMPASLAELRQLIAARGVPSRDVSIEGASFDLAGESGYVAACKHFVLQSTASGRGGPPAAPLYVGDGQSIHDSARLVGRIVVHAGVRIDEHATVLGPAVIAEGAHLAAGAVIAQAVVGPGTRVPPGKTIRDGVLFGPAPAEAPAAAGQAMRSPGARASRAGSRRPRRRPRRPGAHHRDVHLERRRLDMRLKRALDVCVAGVSLFLAAPLLLIISAVIWLESKGKGPLFYGDEREGFQGRTFRCWKFRTMQVGAHAVQADLKALDHTDGPHFKIDRDPRVTRAGRILRATNLDEIPQLFNVLVGEMSLIGPRPSPFRENQICIPWRKARLSVTPGITGLWQVCRHDRSAGDFHQWIEYDLLYVQHFSFWLDLKILAATMVTLGGKATHAPVRWLVRASSPAERRPKPAAARHTRPVPERAKVVTT